MALLCFAGCPGDGTDGEACVVQAGQCPNACGGGQLAEGATCETSANCACGLACAPSCTSPAAGQCPNACKPGNGNAGDSCATPADCQCGLFCNGGACAPYGGAYAGCSCGGECAPYVGEQTGCSCAGGVVPFPDAVTPQDNGPAADTTAGDVLDDTAPPDAPDAGPVCDDADDCGEAEGACLEMICELSACVQVPVADGTGCEDGDACTGDDQCTKGACEAGPAVVCDDGSPCTADSCDPGIGCTTSPDNGVPCDDGNDCTQGDACLAGQCLSGANECEELCNNGVDDNGDNAIDCQDIQCADLPGCLMQCVPFETALECDLDLDVDFGATEATTHLSAWPCAVGTLLEGPELAWVFGTAATVSVTVAVLDAPEGTHVMHLGAALAGSVCSPEICTAASTDSVTFDAKAGGEAWIVLDTPAGSEGTAKLQVTCEQCAPKCTNKSCGSDGCGGLCGTCAPGFKCGGDGSCIAKPENDTCAEALYLDPDALPIVEYGSTAAAVDNYVLLPDSGCPGANDQGMGFGPGDVVYKFTPTETQDYVISVASDFNAALYVLLDCEDPAGSCHAAANAPGMVTETLISSLQKGVTYYIVVDGFGGAAKGDFTLTLNTWPCDAGSSCGGKECGPDTCGGSCGDCSAGLACSTDGQCVEPATNDTCADAMSVTQVPYSIEHKTIGAADDYFVFPEVCAGGPAIVPGGEGAPDLVYHFVAPLNGKYLASVSPQAGFDALLSVRSKCPGGLQDCVSGSDAPAGQKEEAEFVLSAGEQVWIIVDGAQNGDKGAFELSIEQTSCTPQCGGKQCGPDGCGSTCGSCTVQQVCTPGGKCADVPSNDTCASPLAIGALPFTDAGSTVGAGGDYSVGPGDCVDGPTSATEGAGNDVVYSYTAPEEQTVVFSFESLTTNFDTYLYVASDCDEIAAACTASPNAIVDGGESVIVDLIGGQTIFVFVDGFSKPSNGAYTLKAEVF